MNKLAVLALALTLSAAAASAQGVSITVNGSDSSTDMGPRHDVRDARLAITTRDGLTTMMLVGDVVAIQLSEKAMGEFATKGKDAGFLEALLVSGVRLALGKSLEYPVSNLRADYRDGALRLTNATTNTPVFTEIKVNGADVLRAFSPTDAKRFVAALRVR